MHIVNARVVETKALSKNILLKKFHSPEIARNVAPGRFVNVKVSEFGDPLLRRPFSVCDADGDEFYLMFDVTGKGTRILAGKQNDETIDVLGPLGNGFTLEGDYETALLVAGGLGAAPFPLLVKRLAGKRVLAFLGGRTRAAVPDYGIPNAVVASEDDSGDFRGTVVDLLRERANELDASTTKIFACGPNAMLKALQTFCRDEGFACEASLECAMACGFGVCQGCPVEVKSTPDRYALVCKDGPAFDLHDVTLP
ncbi:MAG: dihydroorotate dehydrogenase electron transfer subunit [Ignavibacteriales bacterium]|nr:dihydroorotate dehydrogenase electron transfer subunit [Ignavibacteriales bacterium]